MKHLIMKRLLFLIAAVFSAAIYGCGDNKISGIENAAAFDEQIEIAVAESGDYIEKSEMAVNALETLCVPTQFTKIGNDYFIVDCYHDRILTSKDKYKPISKWLVVTDCINKGHSIAGDNVVYLADDTDNNAVLVFVKEEGVFYLTQRFENVGVRPHFTFYDENAGKFYVLSSMTGEIYIYGRSEGSIQVELLNVKKINELDGVYVRSFSMIDGDMYLPAGNGYIYRVSTDDFYIKEKYQLPLELAGPVQLVKADDMYYMTVSTDIYGFQEFANIVQFESFDALKNGKYESIRECFCMDGTPYVISHADNKYYLTLHSDYAENCLWEFDIDGKNIKNINAMCVENSALK